MMNVLNLIVAVLFALAVSCILLTYARRTWRDLVDEWNRGYRPPGITRWQEIVHLAGWVLLEGLLTLVTWCVVYYLIIEAKLI